MCRTRISWSIYQGTTFHAMDLGQNDLATRIYLYPFKKCNEILSLKYILYVNFSMNYVETCTVEDSFQTKHVNVVSTMKGLNFFRKQNHEWMLTLWSTQMRLWYCHLRMHCCKYLSQWWVEFEIELTWLFENLCPVRDINDRILQFSNLKCCKMAPK